VLNIFLRHEKEEISRKNITLTDPNSSNSRIPVFHDILFGIADANSTIPLVFFLPKALEYIMTNAHTFKPWKVTLTKKIFKADAKVIEKLETADTVARVLR
jgi:hypothetical protein